MKFRVKPAGDITAIPRDHEVFIYVKNGAPTGTADGKQWTQLCWTKKRSDPRVENNRIGSCGPNGAELDLPLGPGQRWKVLSATLFGEWIRRLEDSKDEESLFAFGNILYHDVFNIIHHTRFCFQIEGGRDKANGVPIGEVELYYSQCNFPGANSYD